MARVKKEKKQDRGPGAISANLNINSRCNICVKCPCRVKKEHDKSSQSRNLAKKSRRKKHMDLLVRELKELKDQANEQAEMVSKLEAQLVKAKAPILVDLEPPELMDIKPNIKIKTEKPCTP